MSALEAPIPRLSSRVIVPSFPTIRAMKEAIRAKDMHSVGVDLYPRDGSIALGDLEARFAELDEVRLGSLLLYATGMSAFADAVLVRRPRRILQGEQLYSKAGKLTKMDLTRLGVTERIGEVNAGSLESINRGLREFDPDTLIFESVSNGHDMQVLDLQGLFELPDMKRLKPRVIVDHTLPTASLLPLGRFLETYSDQLTIVQSGTKFHGVNGEMAGMVITYDNQLLTQLQDRRQMYGTLLSNSAVETVAAMLLSKEQFDARNRRIAGNTTRLALACAEGLEGSKLYGASHPLISGHPNREYVLDNYPNGSSPVLFIPLKDAWREDPEEGHFRLADALMTNPTLHKYVKLRQSFGFDETTMWVDGTYPGLRIAGGIEENGVMLQIEQAFKETLASTKDRKVFVNGFGERQRVFSLEDRWEIKVIAQQGENDCGQALLEGWGYPESQIPAEPLTPLDIECTFGGTEVALTKAMEDGTPVMVLARKKNGYNHWFGVVAGKVVNPEGGQVLDAGKYLLEEIAEVIAAYNVPFAQQEER